MVAALPTVTTGNRDDVLRSPEEVAAYIINYSLHAPGFESSISNGTSVSLRQLESEYGQNREGMISTYEERLRMAIQKHFDNIDIEVSVEYKNGEGGFYKLGIMVTSDGVPIFGLGNVDVKDNQIIVGAGS